MTFLQHVQRHARPKEGWIRRCNRGEPTKISSAHPKYWRMPGRAGAGRALHMHTPYGAILLVMVIAYSWFNRRWRTEQEHVPLRCEERRCQGGNQKVTTYFMMLLPWGLHRATTSKYWWTPSDWLSQLWKLSSESCFTKSGWENQNLAESWVRKLPHAKQDKQSSTPKFSLV